MLPINITFRVRDSLSPGPRSEGSSHTELRRHLFPEPQTRSALLVANDLKLSERQDLSSHVPTASQAHLQSGLALRSPYSSTSHCVQNKAVGSPKELNKCKKAEREATLCFLCVAALVVR